ncbi:MAG: Gldg family protein [Acidobacteriia bacterium]|nr:Gldg family protein [Terriglobia bacterium]
MRSRRRVIGAVFRREFFSYFGSPTGYVFITLFVFLSAVAAFWQERFFLNNLANLDQLNLYFPYLLVFLIPSITMSLWAEERKQGTEELLLTLPAGDGELLLGKYFAALGIYTVALMFSLSHVVVLFWLGSPDIGMLASTYLGYWLLGAALLPLGLLASQLTDNLTVAFILGSVLCGAPVFLRNAGAILTGGTVRLAEQLSAVEQFRELSAGIVTLSSLVYFVALGAGVLYLNIALVGRRRWPVKAGSPRLGLHYLVRSLALLAAAGALTVMASRSLWRLDATSEQVHSLSADTLKLLRGLDAKRPVFIQAYLSPEVPRSYLPVRNNISSFLREFSALGRERVNVRILETVKYSTEAREARERYGIQPFRVPVTEESASASNEIFLGLVFTCGGEEFVIPMFDRGLPVEYELMRSVRVVSRAARKKVGILRTGAKLFGGFDFQTKQQTTDWSIVAELKKQYEVVHVPPDGDYPEDLHVLIAALPHTLTPPQLARLTGYVQKDRPAFILVDPLPAFNVSLSPAASGAQPENPFQPAPAVETAATDVRPLLNALGVEWDTRRIAWDTYNPHPELRNLPPEIVFVGKGGFSAKEEITAGLQEMVLLYPGYLKGHLKGNDGKGFQPLLSTGPGSGLMRWDQLVQRSMFGTAMAQGLPHKPTNETYTLAAKAGRSIVVADADVMGEEFFTLRKRGVENLNLDNVSFVLNAIDDLAGERSFIALRKRRPRHRTLEAVEARTRVYEEKRDQEATTAAATAERRLREAQARLDAAVAQVSGRTDLDEQAKSIMINNLQTAETRRLQVARANIEEERGRQIEDARAVMESSVKGIQNTIKLLAVSLPPIPAFVLFVWMSLRKLRRERSRIGSERLVEKAAA